MIRRQMVRSVHRRFATLALLASFLGVASPADAAKIGVAALVQNQVTGTLGGRTTPLGVGSDVFALQRIATGNSGMAQLLFLDQTSFTIGPNADLVLDRFIYDPNKKTGNVVLSTTKGAFRFIAGAQAADSYQIKTPVATIGVRGSVAYGAGAANYWVFYVGEGKGWVIPNGGALIDNIPAGRGVIVLADGRVFITKFDVVDLGLIRVEQLYDLFREYPDNFVDIGSQVIPSEHFGDYEN